MKSTEIIEIKDLHSATQIELAAILGVDVKTVQRNFRDHLVYSGPGTKKINIPLTLASWYSEITSKVNISDKEQSAKERLADAKASMAELELAAVVRDTVRRQDAEQKYSEIIQLFQAGLDRMASQLPLTLQNKKASFIRNEIQNMCAKITDDAFRAVLNEDPSEESKDE